MFLHTEALGADLSLTEIYVINQNGDPAPSDALKKHFNMKNGGSGINGESNPTSEEV